MSVTVHEAREIPTRERGGAQHSQVRLMLLPTRKSKHRTKIRSSDDDNPKFNETFTFKVPPGWPPVSLPLKATHVEAARPSCTAFELSLIHI